MSGRRRNVFGTVPKLSGFFKNSVKHGYENQSHFTWEKMAGIPQAFCNQLITVNSMNSTRLLVTVKLMFSRQLVSPHQESGDRYDQGPI